MQQNNNFFLSVSEKSIKKGYFIKTISAIYTHRVFKRNHWNYSLLTSRTIILVALVLYQAMTHYIKVTSCNNAVYNLQLCPKLQISNAVGRGKLQYSLDGLRVWAAQCFLSRITLYFFSFCMPIKFFLINCP